MLDVSGGVFFEVESRLGRFLEKALNDTNKALSVDQAFLPFQKARSIRPNRRRNTSLI